MRLTDVCGQTVVVDFPQTYTTLMGWLDVFRSGDGGRGERGGGVLPGGVVATVGFKCRMADRWPITGPDFYKRGKAHIRSNHHQDHRKLVHLAQEPATRSRPRFASRYARFLLNVSHPVQSHSIVVGCLVQRGRQGTSTLASRVRRVQSVDLLLTAKTNSNHD